jgi:hypothetical protein
MKNIFLRIIAARVALLSSWVLLAIFLLILNFNTFGIIIMNYPLPFQGGISMVVVCLVSLLEFVWEDAFRFRN